jgi:hypothetical protein
VYGARAKILAETNLKIKCGWNIGGKWVDHKWSSHTCGPYLEQGWNIKNDPLSSKFT